MLKKKKENGNKETKTVIFGLLFCLLIFISLLFFINVSNKSKQKTIKTNLSATLLRKNSSTPNNSIKNSTSNLENGEIEVTDCFNVSNGLIWSPEYNGQIFRFGGTDINAVYWRFMVPNLDGTSFDPGFFQIRGEYPNSNYFSFHLYGSDTHFISKLTDYQINPSTGYLNPFAVGNKSQQPMGYLPGNFYKVNIFDDPNQQGQFSNGINVLYGGYYENGERTESNTIMYRIYEPKDPGRNGGVGLPRIFFITNGTETKKEDICNFIKNNTSRFGENLIIKVNEKILNERARSLAQNAAQKIHGYKPSNPVEWIIGDNFKGMLETVFGDQNPSLDNTDPTGANMDSRYLTGFFDPTKEIAIINFKAPKINEQIRYWSACTYQPLNGIMYAWQCGRYNQFLMDSDNKVTIILSTIQNKPLFACDPEEISQEKTDCRYNWLSYSSPVPTLWIRQLVANDTYPQALVNYKDNVYDSEKIKNFLGEYYPTTKYCSLSSFQEKGINCNEEKIE